MEVIAPVGRLNDEGTRVLLLSNHGEIVGGGEVSLLTLLEGLDRSRWSPMLLVPSEGPVAARCQTLDLPTHVLPLPALRRPGFAILRAIWRLVRLVRRTDATLLHANGSRAMFYAGLAGKLSGRPVVWHVRILDRDPPLDWLLTRMATRTVAISGAVRARLCRWRWGDDRCRVVPNGIDIGAFLPAREPEAVRRALGLDPKDRVIGTVGRLVPFKGHRFLIEAFSRLRRSSPELILLLVGDGPERGALEQAADRLGVSRSVRFVGHREDVADLLTVMELFVLPSVAEHFGRVLLEAMAMKLPVVATAAGGVPEVVEADVTALLVPPEDPAALAGAIETLLGDPARARAMGAAGRRRVEERFTAREHARQVEAVYEEVLAEVLKRDG